MDVRTITIDSIGLSNRSQNALHRAEIYTVGDMLGYTEESLNEIRNLGSKSVEEVLKKIEEYKKIDEAGGLPDEEPATQALTIFEMLGRPEYHDAILKYVRANDKDVRQLGLSNRPINRLLNKGLEKLSDIIFMTKSELQKFPSMGTASVEEIMSKINDYLSANESRLMAVCTGDEAALVNDEAIRDLILKQYQEIGFGGLSFNEMKERLPLPESITDERLKKIIGGLLASGDLEYVDFRCYRIYGRFADCLEHCAGISERSRDFIRKRLRGRTLEEIAQEYDLTRERVRQIVKRDAQKVSDWYTMSTGMTLFDEDYYRYFYSTYAFEKKDAIEWFGMTADIYNYFSMMDVKGGTKDLQSALEDHKGLDAGLRLKIKNYLNRNKIYVDGIWVEKHRSDLEELVVRKFCQNDVSFNDFARIYNEFLEEEEIPFDEDIYYTEAVYRSRKNHLSDARYLLWKQNEQIRYYDIEGRDFAELLDALNLESYENIELSTLRFVEEQPEILAKYDIRDQYELHNLLRKIVPEGSYHDFHCGRMPEIKFGTFDRDEAILDILIDNAPISAAELCTLIHDEYGYDPMVIQANYLQNFAEYYHQGTYTIDQKAMPPERKAVLQAELTEDFYYIDEVRKTYRRLFTDADMEEINPYNLKLMGFIVLSRYVVQNHASLEAFCEDILTREDIIDITPYRKRFVYMQMFSQKLMELKRNLQIIEFEPNQIINFRKLERSGVSREMIQDFCDAVYDFVGEGAYFSARSLKQDGFESELYDLGFSDWFYGNLLISDERFSFGQMFGNIILYKGSENITARSFETNLIRAYGSIDTYDLLTELTDRYGCKISEHMDVVYKIQGTEIYYDRILDRLYASYDVYDRELDRTEGI